MISSIKKEYLPLKVQSITKNNYVAGG